jgi:hypothetical protein
MKMSDYNSTTAALQSEHLDKWHTFNQVVPKTRSNVGWNSRKEYLVESAYAVSVEGSQTTFTGNNSTNSYSTNFTLTGNAKGDTTIGSGAPALAVGSIIKVSSGGVSARLVVKSIVEGVSSASYPVITFEQSTAEVALLWGTTNVSLAAPGAVWTVALYAEYNTPMSSTVWTHKPTINTINIKAHGIDLYQAYPSIFYASYLPYVFGGPNVNVPQDKGCHFVNFAMYPGTYQPSGHVNVSRAREFYFNYTSSVVGANVVTAPSVVNQPAASTNSNSGYLYLLAAAINFLLISDGGAVLRYST